MECTPQIILMLKAPRLGLVKTRLAMEIGDGNALAAYRRLVERQISQLLKWPTQICFTPSDAGNEMRAWLGTAYHYAPQCEGDLGARLTAAMQSAFCSGAEAVLFLGGDCPSITRATLRRAQQALDKSDVVLGPALDGGYYLIALKKPRPELFLGITWSSSEVLTQTISRATDASLIVALLEPMEDVDDRASWERAKLSSLI